MKALATWQLPEPLPPALRGARLDAAIAAMAEGVRPAEPRAMAAALAGLLDYAATFDVPVADRKAALREYVDAMRDMPSDLVVEAVARAKREWRANRLPTSANLRAFVLPEIEARRHALKRLHTAHGRQHAAPEPMGDTEPPSAETMRQVAALARRLRGLPNTTQEPTDADLARLKAQALAQVAATKEDAA